MMYSDLKPIINRDTKMAALILYLSYDIQDSIRITQELNNKVTFKIKDYHSFIDELNDKLGLPLLYYNPFSKYTFEQLFTLDIVIRCSNDYESFAISKDNFNKYLTDLLFGEYVSFLTIHEKAIPMLDGINQQVIEERIIELL